MHYACVVRPCRGTACGRVLGAIGPHQIAARAVVRRGERCRDVMVPVAALRPVAASSPAVDLVPRLAGYGFVPLTGPDVLGYVEASDLATQIRIWMALRERGVARWFGQRRGRAGAQAKGGGTSVE